MLLCSGTSEHELRRSARPAADFVPLLSSHTRSYVPIKSDYSDLLDTAAYFIGAPDGSGSHDLQGKKLAENGKKWAEEHGREADMAAYLFRLCERHLLCMRRKSWLTPCSHGARFGICPPAGTGWPWIARLQYGLELMTCHPVVYAHRILQY